MEFVALPFPYFFLVVVTGVWMLRGHRVARNPWLCAASAWFAWKWQPLFLVCLLGSSSWNYLAGELLFRSEAPRRRRAIATLAVLGNAALLGYFEYAGFFVENLADLSTWLGLPADLPVMSVIAPLGISFYTFQGIGYVIDCARGQAVRPRSPLDFLLYFGF